MTAVRGAGLTRFDDLGDDLWLRCHRVVRDQGVAPALTLLRSAVLPGLLPCGPAGHAVVPEGVAAGSGPIWLDGVTSDPPAGQGTRLGGFDLPGGRLVALRRTAGSALAPSNRGERAAWALGLAWLRLGVSEALRDECLRYLRARRTGDSVLVRQQLVKGALAEALSEHLEVRAVLTGAGPGDLAPPVLADLHTSITRTDRAQLKLLGASSMLLGGPGEVGYVSELIADAYLPERIDDLP